MSRRSSKKNAISLFPFLAVLVCTMGALILLLLVTTRRMHKEQQQAAEVAEQVWDAFDDSIAETSPTADAFLISLNETRSASQAETPVSFSTALLPPKPVADEQPLDTPADAFQEAMELAGKQRSHDQLQQQLVAEQENQTELKRQIADIKQQLQFADDEDSEYQSQMEQLSELKRQESELEQRLQQKQLALAKLQSELDASSDTTTEAESLLRAQESALVRLRQIVAEAEANSAVGTDQTIVEFTNPSGTKRTPILVNVTAQGFEFLPSGIRVTHENMKETPDRYNPLVAGVLAINQYRNPNASSVQPYVLLLVRPDGGSVFYSAKSAFQEFGLHWGYELLEQDHKIAAGTRDDQEAEIARAAVLEALSKRFPDFNKYAALKEQLVEELAARTQTESDRRSVTMLPDGTMILPGDNDGQAGNMPEANKRFYAGGHAPRTESEAYRPAAEPFEEKIADADQASPAQPDSEIENPFAVIAGMEGQAPANTKNAAPFDFPSGVSESAEGVAQQIWGDGKPDTVDKKTETGAFGFPNSNAPDITDLATIDHRTLLRKRRILSDNMGVGGRQASDQVARNMATELAESTSSNASSLSRTDPREPTDWTDSMTAKHGSATPPAGQAGDFSNTDAFDFGPAAEERAAASSINDSTTADVNAATANSGERNPFVPTQDTTATVQSAAGNPHGEPGGVAAGSGPASDEESFLSKFLKKVEQERAEHQPDPMLVSMLNNARRKAKAEKQATKVDDAKPATTKPVEAFDWSSAAQQKPDQSSVAAIPLTAPSKVSAKVQPQLSSPQLSRQPETAIHNRQQQVYYVIKIYVEQDQLTVGDYETVSTKDWTSVERLALTLQAISATMDEVWATARPDAAPAVRFLVAPDADDIQQELAKTLASMNVPTRGVIKTQQGVTAEEFFSNTDSAAKKAAEPVEPAPVQARSGRRTSI